MTRLKFEQVEHTADAAVRVYGETLEELFVHAAEALFEIIGPCPRRKEALERPLTLEAESPAELLHDWLAELNYLHQTRHEIYYRFVIGRLSDHRLEASVAGEPIEAGAHRVDREVKAVTYHRLAVEQVEQGWRAFVVFDI